MRIYLRFALALILNVCLLTGPAPAATLEFPQIVRMRYEATDQKAGGNFTIWLDRETIRQGLDPRLFPAAIYVDISYITPSTGSPPLTIIEVLKLGSTTPEFYHVAGTIRFRVNGMVLTSSNVPR